jgi:co-chaperonin GroES (HSP10)
MGLNYEVFGDRVLLKKLDEPVEEKTEGGIILPIETQEKEQKNKLMFFGEVVLKGIDANLVSVGDVVIFNQATTQKLFLEGEEYYLVTDNVLIGKKL